MSETRGSGACMDGNSTSDGMLRVIDPHMHFWTVDVPNPNLGDIVHTVPHYTPADYVRDVRGASKVTVVGIVPVETIVGQKAGGAKLDEVGETSWLMARTGELPATIPVRLVPYCHLAREDVETVLDKHAAIAGSGMVGVRMILNYDADDATLCWPQVEGPHFLDPTTTQGAAFKKGFGLLVARGLSFDLQCNPPQLAQAAAMLRDFPTATVIVNHMGCPRQGQGVERDAMVMATWREGMAALAAFPNVFVKVSMLQFVHGDWESNDAHFGVVQAMFHHCIDLFGCDRVMFASNFPVDRYAGTTFDQLYTSFRRLTTGFSPAQVDALFHGTAARAYRF